MSRKTKADLEIENKRLRHENEALRGENGLLQYLLDAETSDNRVLSAVHKSDVENIVQRDTSRVRKEVKAFTRRKYIQSRYAEHRKDNNIKESRDRANDDLVEKFGEKHRLKERRLRVICKD